MFIYSIELLCLTAMKGCVSVARITMQELADSLGTSRITVWKALTNRPGVSDTLRAEIQHKAQELGYYAAERTAHAQPQRTFSVVVARPESSAFWMQIIHYAAKELALHGINLMYTYMPALYRPGYELPASLEGGAVGGFIVLNIYDQELLRLLSKSPLPKVFLDTIPAMPECALGGDLLIIEGRTRVCDITARLLDRGYRRLGFVGDVNYAQTNMDRYRGFLDAHAAHGVTPDPALSMTGSLGLRSHYEEISRFLASLPALPDAFICPSDFIAHYIQRYLSETGVPAGKCPILTGFDNNAEYANVAEQITTVDVDTSSLGKRLARQLIYRADYPQAPYETTYFSTQILYRGALAQP